MHRFFPHRFYSAALATLATFTCVLAQAAGPLESWNDGPSKKAIIEFVAKTTKAGSPDFVPPAERIATFDNDGTLWVEHPMYTQLAFAIDRVKEMAPQHPEWKTTQPFKAVLDNDMKALGAAGEKGILELVMATHSGMSTDEFEAEVKAWFAKARHSRFKQPYTALAYLPMVELLEYLRAHGFKTFIVSGGGIEFMRPMTQAVYGIPPEQVVGSSIKTKFQMIDGKPVIMRLPEIDFVDDKDGKVLGINSHIGQRPMLAFGNTDGDRQMLEYTQGGSGARLMGLVLHDDAEREYSYGPANGLPPTHFGSVSQELIDYANKQGWHVVSMKNDWKRVFAFEE